MEVLEITSDDVTTTALDIELTEGDTASIKGSQFLAYIMAVNRGALSFYSRELQKCRRHSSGRTVGLARYF